MKVKVGSKRKVALWFMLFTIVSLVVFVNFYKPPFGYLRVERMLLPENTELAKKVSGYSTSEIVKSGKVSFSMDVSLKDYKELRKLLKNGNYVKLNGSYYYVDLVAIVV